MLIIHTLIFLFSITKDDLLSTPKQDTTIDYGGQYAKNTVNRRIARFFGVF